MVMVNTIQIIQITIVLDNMKAVPKSICNPLKNVGS